MKTTSEPLKKVVAKAPSGMLLGLGTGFIAGIIADSVVAKAYCYLVPDEEKRGKFLGLPYDDFLLIAGSLALIFGTNKKYFGAGFLAAVLYGSGTLSGLVP